jgi:hypothetical protein
MKNRRVFVFCSVAFLLSCVPAWCQSVKPVSHTVDNGAPVRHDAVWEVRHATTPPLRELAHQSLPSLPRKLVPPDEVGVELPAREYPLRKDEALQTQSQPGGLSANIVRNFDGLSADFLERYRLDDGVPPDPNGAVGTTQYVEVVNFAMAVYDKSGNLLEQMDTNQLWNDPELNGSECQGEDQGDATVAFDRLAQRWVIQQMALGPDENDVHIGPYYDCVAVSTSDDATGTWNAYIFGFNFGSQYLNDYPKLGTWPVAYPGLPQILAKNDGWPLGWLWDSSVS